MKLLAIATAAGAASLVLAACAAPVLDVAEPPAEERGMARMILLNTTLDPAPDAAEWRGDIGFWHVTNSVRPHARAVCRRAGHDDQLCERANFAHVTLVRDSRINAFANHEGNIAFFTGLAEVLGSDAEAAAVLAHEFAHVMLGHVDAMVQNEMTGYLIGAFLGGALAGAMGVDPQSLGDSFMQTGAEIGRVAYSREMEIEADRMAVHILHAAGYPPEAMRDAIVRVHRLAPDASAFDIPVGFFETHPRDDRRIANIMAAIRDAKAGVPLTVKGAQ